RHATVTRRRVDGQIEIVRAEGLVTAAFRHRTSRAGDPQVHTHCLAANVVERIDGGWGALHSPPLYRHARTAGFVYQAVLRGELTSRLAVEWGEVTNGHAEIGGIDGRLLRQFSKRRAEIEAVLSARGADSPSAAQTAALASRRAKDHDVDPETLTERWAAEAATLDSDVAAVWVALGRRRPVVRPPDLDAVVDELTGPHGLTSEQAAFDRRDVVRGWCEGLPAGVPLDLETIEELVEGLLEDQRVVQVVDEEGTLAASQLVDRPDGSATTSVYAQRRWSTVEMLAIEGQLLDRAANSGRIGVATVDADVIDTVTASAGLTAEQAAMVRELCSAGNGIDVVVGRAGTGKTYALAAASQAWRLAGHRPMGIAIAARAAAELETGAGLPSSTIAQFLIDCDSGATLDPRSVVVVDEAGMVDTRRLARVAAHVHAAGAKLVLVGDHHQLPAVEAGGAFAALVHRLQPVELHENRRQTDAWERTALDDLREGRGGFRGMLSVIDRYDGHGRLHVGATPADVRMAMVDDWYRARMEGQEPIMLALRRRDVAELNGRARALLLADGTIDRRGVTAGDRTFAAGDRVVCLHNDRRLGVHNALFATVATAAPDRLVLTSEADGRHIDLPIGYAADGHLDHAWATTIHKAQGATYDHALLLGDDRLYRQAGYTGLSRGRSNDIYLVTDDDLDVDVERHGCTDEDDPEERFARALNRDGSKRLASEEVTSRRPGPASSLTALWSARQQALRPGERRAEAEQLEEALRQRVALAGRAAEIDRPAHIIDLLGHPPTDITGRQRWRAAAGEIESYQARWSVELTDGDHHEVLGEQADHLRQVVDAIAAVDQHQTPELAVELA
ncbi:MAG TPA: MobF family relaxase, partial [Candidatus Limnocylindria bacterium]